MGQIFGRIFLQSKKSCTKLCIIFDRRKSTEEGINKMDHLQDWISAAAKGDVEAFNQLYNYSYSTVEHECLRILHNSFDAEDAMQEAYLIIYKKIGTLKDPSKFLSWCRTIAHNTSASFIANRKRKTGRDDFKPMVSDDDVEGMDSLNGLDESPSPEERAEQEMVHELLQQAMDSIAPQRSMCLAMHQQGYSYDQIASLLSIPLGTVKSNIHYAKEALKKQIREFEKKENVQIFGFTLVPVGQHVEVRMDEPGNGRFIQADTSKAPTQEDVWESVSRQISSSTAAHLKVWQKVAAVVVALAVIVGGIVFAMTRVGHENLHEKRSETSVSQGSQRNYNRAASQRLAPSNGNLTGTNAGAGVGGTRGAGITVTQTATGRRTTAPEPQVPRETTRESFTNRVQNLRNAMQGEN